MDIGTPGRENNAHVASSSWPVFRLVGLACRRLYILMNMYYRSTHYPSLFRSSSPPAILDSAYSSVFQSIHQGPIARALFSPDSSILLWSVDFLFHIFRVMRSFDLPRAPSGVSSQTELRCSHRLTVILSLALPNTFTHSDWLSAHWFVTATAPPPLRPSIC